MSFNLILEYQAENENSKFLQVLNKWNVHFSCTINAYVYERSCALK